MFRRSRALVLLLLVLAPACANVCVRHSDCPLDYVCRPDGWCELPPDPPAPDAEPDPSPDAGPGSIPDLPDAAADPDDASEEPADAADDADVGDLGDA